MSRGDLDIPERYAGIEGGHDERGTKHVLVDSTEPGRLPIEPTQR